MKNATEKVIWLSQTQYRTSVTDGKLRERQGTGTEAASGKISIGLSSRWGSREG